MANLPKSVSELTKMIAKMPGFSEKGAERYLEWWWQRQLEKKDFAANWDDFIKLKTCQKCFSFAYTDLCDFCNDKKRDKSKVCVVTSPFTAATIETEAGYNGLYFVLGGEVVNGRASKAVEMVKKRVEFLSKRVAEEKVNELIIATDFTIRGEATAIYIKDILKSTQVNFTRLAQGFQTGSQIDYGDSVTLKRAFEKREKIS